MTQATDATANSPEPSQPFGGIDRVRDALEDAGLRTDDIGNGIVNVYGPGGVGEDSYLYTVTVTVTP